ncbi:MAG: TetR/AcrR family transcriptional regulator [Planctomycetota bacterium]|jgi:AcrR family transcriptional regulator|nr:TetR/AcrR family transcriptional regulator [Planctomycetota bacterium]
MKNDGGDGLPNYDVFGERYQLPLMDIASRTKVKILIESTVLFAKSGYSTVSIKDIARAIGIKPASVYNHFPSKEALWDAVMEHAVELYLLYLERLAQKAAAAASFAEALEISMMEPRKMSNDFTCYAFSLMRTEQFRNEKAWDKYNQVFLRYSLDFFTGVFAKHLDDGSGARFDAGTVATIIMNSVLMGIDVQVQKLLGRKIPYEPSEMLVKLQEFLLLAVAGA